MRIGAHHQEIEAQLMRGLQQRRSKRTAPEVHYVQFSGNSMFKQNTWHGRRLGAFPDTK